MLVLKLFWIFCWKTDKYKCVENQNLVYIYSDVLLLKLNEDEKNSLSFSFTNFASHSLMPKINLPLLITRSWWKSN
jgi:hypothetical protein